MPCAGRIHYMILGGAVAVASLGGHWIAASMGKKVGAALAKVVSQLHSASPDPEPEWVVLELPSPAASANAEAEQQAPRSGRRRLAKLSPKESLGTAPPRGLRVRAATVLRIADSGAQPIGIPVEESAQRPAGILLTNVGNLGIGLRDGDILVTAAGAPARDVGAVVGRIVSARGAKASVIEGEVWRRGVRFPIAVEQPYLPLPASGSAVDSQNVDAGVAAPDQAAEAHSKRLVGRPSGP